MKPQYYLYILILTGLASCKKFLDTKPTSFPVTSNYYTTQANLQAGLVGVYSSLATTQLYGQNLAWTYIGTTDETAFRATGSAAQQADWLYNYTSTDAGIQGIWQQLYVGIERANVVLVNINTPTGMTTSARNSIQGQALFLRAYYHFLLVSLFGGTQGVPLILKPTANINNTAVARTPSKDVYTQIIADMTTADTLLTQSAQTEAKLGYCDQVTSDAVEGILTRVCLTNAGYPVNDASKYKAALYWANKLINSGNHSLNPDYTQVFKNLAADKYDVKESIWEIAFWGNSISPSPSFNSPIGRLIGMWGGQSQSLITGKLYNSYAAWDTVRRNWNCPNFDYTYPVTTVPLSTFITSPTVKLTNIWNYYAGKYRRIYETVSPVSGSPENFPLIRYADVLLMQAEAENQLNGPDAVAVNAVNQVRRRAFNVPTATTNPICDVNPTFISSKQMFQDSVINPERMRELCFEGQRRNDLIRWGNFYNDMQTFQNYAKLNGGTAGGTLVLTTFSFLSPKNVVFPIPATDISVNPLLTQNPGW